MRTCLDAIRDHILGIGLYKTEAAFTGVALCCEFTNFESKKGQQIFVIRPFDGKHLLNDYSGLVFSFRVWSYI